MASGATRLPLAAEAAPNGAGNGCLWSLLLLLHLFFIDCRTTCQSTNKARSEREGKIVEKLEAS